MPVTDNIYPFLAEFEVGHLIKGVCNYKDIHSQRSLRSLDCNRNNASISSWSSRNNGSSNNNGSSGDMRYICDAPMHGDSTEVKCGGSQNTIPIGIGFRLHGI